MEAFESYVPPLLLACRELLPLVQNHAYAIDVNWVRLAIDRVFNEPRIDLLSVLPQSGYGDSDLTNEFEQVLELFGAKSLIFKVVLESCDELFQYFLSSFCAHLECSSCILPSSVIERSVYMHLLEQYVCFMLPLDDQSSVTAGNFHSDMPINCSYRSPLNVFTEESLRRYSLSPSSHSLSTLQTISQSLSPHFSSFICILVRSYCSLSSWPSDYRLIALRFVLREIHVFSLAETENLNLAQVKWQLQCNAPFADSLFDFFLSLFTRWPFNPSFTYLFDAWITWIRPWRYCNNDLGRVMAFARSNRRFYVDLSNAFLRRTMPLDEPSSVWDIKAFISVLTSPEMLQVYSELNYDIEDSIIIVTESLRKNLHNLRQTVIEEEEKLKKENWLKRLLFCEEEEFQISRHKQAADELEKLLGNIDVARVANFQSDAGTEKFTQDLSVSRYPFRIPDHSIDPTTKLMYLTPLGRRQVGLGTHRFDFSKCAQATPPIFAPLRRNEIWWLSRLLYHLSQTINQTEAIKRLSDAHSDHNSPLGFIARLLLDPEYPRITVPAYSTEVVYQKPCLNLRYLARYDFVIPFLMFMLMLIILPFKHALIAFSFMILYTWLIQ